MIKKLVKRFLLFVSAILVLALSCSRYIEYDTQKRVNACIEAMTGTEGSVAKCVHQSSREAYFKFGDCGSYTIDGLGAQAKPEVNVPGRPSNDFDAYFAALSRRADFENCQELSVVLIPHPPYRGSFHVKLDRSGHASEVAGLRYWD